MTILCIETSTSVCSAALCREGQCLRQYINREGSNHARLLPVYIEQLLREAREKGLTIEAIGLSEGPGSYTGLRIGASTAKGLCYGLNVPLIPVQTLDVLCESAEEKLPEVKETSRVLVPMIDARRMEVYCKLKGEEGKVKGEEVRAVVVENEESLVNSEELRDNSEAFYYFGDGAEKCQAVLKKENWKYIPEIVPEAQYVGLLAEKTNRKVEGKELAYYEPFYLKEFIAAQSHVKGLN